MRKRRALLLALVVFVGAALTWRVYPDLHQRQLDNRLLAAISRSDTPAVLSLLDQGADPNAHGDPTVATVSLWQMLREYFTQRTPRSPLDIPAPQIALGIRVSKGKELDINITNVIHININSNNHCSYMDISTYRDAEIIIALLQHGGTMRPAAQVVFHPFLREDPRHTQNDIGFTMEVPTGQEVLFMVQNKQVGNFAIQSPSISEVNIIVPATPQQLLAFRKATKIDKKR